MAKETLSVSWFLPKEETNTDADNLLIDFYLEIAGGVLQEYRQITQYGKKHGQTYFTHVMDGIGVLHQLRQSGVLEMTELEEQLLLAAYCIHDINKIWTWRYPDEKKVSYAQIATPQNIEKELAHLKMEKFFPNWWDYLPEIVMLAKHHQHDGAPLDDLDRRSHNFKHDYERLKDLGQMVQAADNLDLSHTLDEAKHKEQFLGLVNNNARRHWKWLKHQIGENRGVLTNIIHNQTADYLASKYSTATEPGLAPLLYYPDGIAYLIPKKAEFSWTTADVSQLAENVSGAISKKQGSSFAEFIKNTPAGIKVNEAALEGGASFNAIMNVIDSIIDRKQYKEEWYTDYSGKLLTDIRAAAEGANGTFAKDLLASANPVPPLVQTSFKLGELATAYRNLLDEHLNPQLKILKRDAWTHTYLLLGLPEANFPLYGQINSYRRGYFIARDCNATFETVFEQMQADLEKLTGEQVAQSDDKSIFQMYLTNNLEFSSANYPRQFKEHLLRYIEDEHAQCSNCSSPIEAEEWMASNAPRNVGVQSFSNRLLGGSSREPKRNICGVCRAQFILEKISGTTHDDKHGGKYTTFYYHFYPYSFFTKPHLAAMFQTLSSIGREDSRNFFFNTSRYFGGFETRLTDNVKRSFAGEAKELKPLAAYPTKVNGVANPNFSDAVGNTPTLAIHAPGSNYGEQFLFALTHALMLADFFSCRLVLSRTPVPLFNGSYIEQRKLAFFVDGVPRNLRWLLPTDEYASLQVFHERADFEALAKNWAHSQPVENNQAIFEHIYPRIETLYLIAQELKSSKDAGYETVVWDLAVAAADDPLRLFYYATNALEKKMGEAKEPAAGKAKAGGQSSGESLTILVAKRIVPLLDDIVRSKDVQALKEMAQLAVKYHIRGRSSKRNSILKPLDIIFDNLEKTESNYDDELLDLVESASKRQIFDHLDAISTFDMGKGTQDRVNEYSDVFYNKLLRGFHKKDVNRLLQRKKLIRSAYLLYFYEVLPVGEKKKFEEEQKQEQQMSLFGE